MESHRHHLVFVLALTLVCGVVAPADATSRLVPSSRPKPATSPPGKPTEQTTIGARTDPQGIVIGAKQIVHNPGSAGQGGKTPSKPGRGHILPVKPPTIPPCQIIDGPDNLAMIICNGQSRGAIPPPSKGRGFHVKPSPSPILAPRDVALSMADRIPIPQVGIHSNPTKGMVGVESWFWIIGFDGAAIDRTEKMFQKTIRVRAVVVRYDWSYGDGGSQTVHTTGQPYPARSEIRHTYERSSAGRALGYPVRVDFQFDVTYKIDNGAWQTLPPITRSAATWYPVRESQAVIGQ